MAILSPAMMLGIHKAGCAFSYDKYQRAFRNQAPKQCVQCQDPAPSPSSRANHHLSPICPAHLLPISLLLSSPLLLSSSPPLLSSSPPLTDVVELTFPTYTTCSPSMLTRRGQLNLPRSPSSPLVPYHALVPPLPPTGDEGVKGMQG
eukprot:764987-Hanusia_phi.AAC.9